jgi:membrane protein implicated in regulation of membrane protease activity
MHKLSLRAQFGILLGLGVAIGFIFLMMVQMAAFPNWLGISLVTMVFVASLFGTRIFLRSLGEEEKEEEERVRREANDNLFDGGYSDLNPSRRSGDQR